MKKPAINRRNNRDRIGIHARTGVFNKRSLLFVLYAIYIAFILVSTIPYLAEQHTTRYEKVGDTHTYHIVFEADGDDTAHYFEVVRANDSKPGVLDLTYYPISHTLTVDAENLKELRLESGSLYEDEAGVIVGTNYNDDPYYYKQWFIDKEEFTVTVNTDTEITKLVIENVPLPKKVLVDGADWWNTNTNYEVTDDDVEITQIPVGTTTVIIDFVGGGTPPTAAFTVDKTLVTVNEQLAFDASGSTDADGNILHYTWNFGDGNEGSGVTIEHSYTAAGNYTVDLTVRDNDYLEGSTSKTIMVVQKGVDSDNDGVPDEVDPSPFSNVDTDGDGISDDFEQVLSHTDPTKKDSDDDGWSDKTEWDEQTNPNDPKDHPEEAEDEEELIFGLDYDSLILLILMVIVIILLLAIFGLITKMRKKGIARMLKEEQVTEAEEEMEE